jgi:hypothetical protein
MDCFYSRLLSLFRAASQEECWGQLVPHLRLFIDVLSGHCYFPEANSKLLGFFVLLIERLSLSVAFNFKNYLNEV